MNEILFNTETVSKLLHVSKSTVKRWTDEGILKCVRTPGGHRKFTLSNIQEFTSLFHFYPLSSDAQLLHLSAPLLHSSKTFKK